MNIQTIKKKIENKIGSRVRVVCNCARNKKEEYYGSISEVYSYIFIVKLDSSKNKSFCYCDVLTNNVELYFDNIL